MKEIMWQKALDLALFEWKIKLTNRLLIQFITLITLFVYMITVFNDAHFEEPILIFEMLFIAFLLLGYGWSTPMEFQLQRINENHYASPVLFMLQNLPINKSTLIRSRFLLFYLNLAPLLILLFILFYISPAIRNVMTPYSYFVFSLFWISFSLSFGSFLPASDIRTRQMTQGKLLFYIFSFIVFISLITQLGDFVYGGSFINLIIYLSNHDPFWLALFSITLIPLTLVFWVKYLQKKISKEDYDLS
ncbi:hypothetical protein ACFSW4_08025 [Piscibacillus salipiscarius]|uniref:ABC-2 type transport system permease protein n=2 Tax=Piscibacillus salipiscarius TaxID=299480 RepID=A0ABW5QA60_9BACI